MGTDARESESDAVTKLDRPTPRPSADDHLERGTLIGRYVVLGVLGRGGMGVVYRAYDPELDRKLAIKLLTVDPADGSATGSVRDNAWLLREAQALARLSHPNVVAVHDVGALPDDRVFVAMELVEGVTLRRWMREPRPWRDVVAVLRAAGAGLAAAHAAGLVHRDFKPENVIVGDDGRVRVMDFGLARLHGDRVTSGDRIGQTIEAKSPLSEQLTLAGTVVGTPAYIAPELYAGGAADARTDQFAFGVALYEALFRDRPYAKEQLAHPDKAAPPKPPADTKVPARVQRVVLRAIALAADARFATMDELLTALAIDTTMRRRRVVALAIGGSAVAALAIGSAWMLRAPASEPCTGIAARAWDDGARARVRTAFVATKKPYANDAFAGVARALDRYAADWTDAVVGSCRATARGEQTEDVHALRQACFDQRLDELHALVAVLETSDASIVEAGDKVAAGLESLAKCNNVAALRAPTAVAPELAADAQALQKKVAEAKANLTTGKYLPVMSLVKDIHDRAKRLGFEPLVAEALMLRGTTLLLNQNYADAEATFAEATFAAIRGKRDDIAAEAGLAAAMTIADQNGAPERARIWLGHAVALASRVGVDHAIERARYEVEGLIAVASGDYNAAIAAHDKALAAARLAFGKDSPAIFNDEILVATTLAKAGVYGESIPHFEHAIVMREAAVGRDHPDMATLHSDLGASYTHAGELVKARAALARALEMRERFYGKTSPVLIPTLDNYGELLRRERDFAGALALQERALALARYIPGKSHPTYHQLATDYADTLVPAGRFADAHRVFDEVMALEDQTKSTVLLATLAARAELALAEHAWADAAAFASRSIDGYEAAGGKTNPALWRPLVALARARHAEGRTDEARELIARALAIGAAAHVTEADLADARAAAKEIGGR